MIQEVDLGKELVLNVFFGFMGGFALLLISGIIQRIWYWIDDNENKCDNYICVLVVRIINGNPKDNNEICHAGARLIFFSGGLGFLYYLYQYFLIYAIGIVMIHSILFLTRYVRRLHKKIDSHLLNHK